MIYLAVSDQLADRPQLQREHILLANIDWFPSIFQFTNFFLASESALSSVAVLGECEGEPASPARVLLKPLILSFRHCASVFPRDNWSFVLYADEGTAFLEFFSLVLT